MPESLVLLHGFSGTHRAWEQVIERLDPERYLPLALDTPGQGAAAHVERPITFSGCVSHVLAASPERFALCGYSQGARIALHLALAAPERVSRLILIGANPGIEDADERAARRRSDHRLADELESLPFAEFIERWRTQPLFAAEPPEAAALARADQLRNDPHALAAVLRGIGTGEMQPLWDRLSELHMSVSVIAGERDAKFLAIGERMVALLPNAQLAVLAGGHGLPLENPAGVGQVIQS